MVDSKEKMKNIILRGLAVSLSIVFLVTPGCLNQPVPEKNSPVLEKVAENGVNQYDIAVHNESTQGNTVDLLLDGPPTYDAMFAAIAQAQDHINLETFILADDIIGQKLAAALADRARAGVVVNLIYDAFGSGMTSDQFFDDLAAEGVNILKYHGVLDTKPWHLNNRNHRKVLIVDGKTGFTGGLNFTKVYRFSSESPPSDDKFGEGWRDTHVRIEGPAVAEMQRAFLRTWIEHSDEIALQDANYFPELDQPGNTPVMILVVEGGDNLTSAIFDHYIAAVNQAKQRVWIVQAYFLPTKALLSALKEAAHRGVDVRLILPKRTDNGFTIPATRSYYTGMLKAGIRLFEYETSHLHAKTALVDDDWSTVGSSNLDTLSYIHNDELNAIIMDREFNAKLAASFEVDMTGSREIKQEEWAKRGLMRRIKEVIGRFFKPVL